ncbi:MAG: adenosylmethionine--8-amino-7-oxononanoate transaminase [Alphaproteobacteria bacterium]|nr:adenosylmethionine--8-amino-7-oxononanoate transaminase [Alphaproteobacteria bacterium]
MSLWHPFTQMRGFAPIGEVVEARGAWLTLADGRRLFDGISSWWVTLHGHSHPRIVQAIAEQAARFDQVILADFTHRPAAELARRLAARMPGDLDHVFFSDDGSTAVEVALKMAWQGQRAQDPRRDTLVAMRGAYHGDTLGAMSVTERDVFSQPFNPLLVDVVFLEWRADAIQSWFQEHGHRAVACIAEPLVQGAQGMRFHDPALLRTLAEACQGAGAWLIADEVMTGFGRLGTLLACERAGVSPELVCLSKGITGGALALGATVCTDAVYRRFLGDRKLDAFLHGHSYTGNPIACATALASLALFEEEQTLARVAALEARYAAQAPALAALPGVTNLRFMGSILAFEVEGGPGGYFDPAGARVCDAALARGLFLRPLGNTVYLLPPLCTTPDELGWCLDVLAAAIQEA